VKKREGLGKRLIPGSVAPALDDVSAVRAALPDGDVRVDAGARARTGERERERLAPTLKRGRAGGGRPNLRLEQSARALRAVGADRSRCRRAARRAVAPAAAQAHVRHAEAR
jgi:hypothetical protein